jgi:4-hydroxybenzoate polyprenyltransferase/phosphoserine phosphatase
MSGFTVLSDGMAAKVDPIVATPLVVDLDGTLLRTDLLVESAFSKVATRPRSLIPLLRSLMQGRAAFKAAIAHDTDIDVTHLPYDERVLELIRDAKASGRPVYLASASNERYVRAVVKHLGLFDGWYASTDTENLESVAKARKLAGVFEDKGFDYIGNGRADLAVWSAARRCFAVDPSAEIRRRLKLIDPNAVVLEPPGGQLRAWLKLLRIHQWVKNALVFVPLLAAHRFDAVSMVEAFGAFFAFSLAASAVYIINDLVDIEADRKHLSKKRRPLAAGTVPILAAMVFAPVIMAIAFVVALLTTAWFAPVLLGYVALTTAYTFVLKRKMMVDIIVLASLYTIRVIGGAVAISVPVSEWLLAFSMFIFTALALIKRYIELAARVDAGLPDPSNRDYRKSDLAVISSLAAAAGFNAVTVFALYVSSDAVRLAYHHPQVLWLVCPILMYWVARMLLMAHRRLVDDDPVVFAATDPNSLFALGMVGLIMLAAL